VPLFLLVFYVHTYTPLPPPPKVSLVPTFVSATTAVIIFIVHVDDVDDVDDVYVVLVTVNVQDTKLSLNKWLHLS
jgi:hypothetical protein